MKKVGCSCGLLLGGGANNRANAGLSYVNTNNTPSNASANIGSRLWFSKVKDKTKREQRPCRSAKDGNFKWILVEEPKISRVKSKHE